MRCYEYTIKGEEHTPKKNYSHNDNRLLSPRPYLVSELSMNPLAPGYVGPDPSPGPGAGAEEGGPQEPLPEERWTISLHQSWLKSRV